jgi:hypothetical protein
VYRAVHEYRAKYPGKAVVYSADGNDQNGWAAFMAGGSLVNIPAIAYPEFLSAASAMQPVDLLNQKGQWMLENLGRGYIVYSDGSEPVKLDLTKFPGSFTVQWIDPKDGHAISKEEKVKGGTIITLKNPHAEAGVAWVSKN